NNIEKNNKSLTENILNLKENTGMTTLQELTDFEWDRVYQFFSYADPEKIVGNLKGVDLGMSLEGSEDNNILFMKNDKPVCYIRGSKDEWGFKINLNDFSDKGNCIMYNYDDIHTLMIEGSSGYYVSLYMPCDETEIFYSEGLDEDVKSEIIYSKSEWLHG
ncbi:MAG: hypothetical protein LUH47_03620, partial [Clostridiales bacterium]|nr:hypothetical protein [Clostridiales bacterium]